MNIVKSLEHLLTRPTAVGVDLDGTLCDSSGRQHHLDKSPPDWESFFEGIPEDPPNPWCVKLVEAMRKAGHQIIYVTGRHERYRQASENWLSEHLGPDSEEDILMMRQSDQTPDSEIKINIFKDDIAPTFDVVFHIDDRPNVVRALRESGLVVLAVDDRGF